VGEYLILASLNSDFTTANNFLVSQLIHISDISFVNNQADLFVLNRTTGQPLAGATVQTYQKSYNYKTSAYDRKKIAVYTSDRNGYVQLNLAESGRKTVSNQLLFEISYNKDRLFVDEETRFYSTNQDENNRPQQHVFLFTDRSIYRPGQTIHFKGIAVNRQLNGLKASILEGYKTELVLYDANNQKVGELEVTTNEFGSFSGKLPLPQSGLNGMYSLRTKDYGYITFRVEEYKRPRFYVDFNPVKEAYKANEEVTVTGYAKAYAGNPADGAQVKYRVVREARFPYPWRFGGSYAPGT